MTWSDLFIGGGLIVGVLILTRWVLPWLGVPT